VKTMEPSRWYLTYHESANKRDGGIIVNYCPWCGGTPGDANRMMTEED